MPDRGHGGGPGRGRAPDPERAAGGREPGQPEERQRAAGRGHQALDRERQPAGRERQSADRERQQLDREQQKADRARQALDRAQQRVDRARQQADRLKQRLEREQQKADRQRLDRERQQAGRGRRAQDQRGAHESSAHESGAYESGADESGAENLWPPFGPESASDRSTHAYRLMRKQAERGPRGGGGLAKAQSLSRAEIVDAAIAIADAEGADAVSMRRIAQVLKAGTMSLYWHVANKDHLLDLMIDTLMAEVAIPQVSGDWRADLQAFARNYRAMLLRHLWVMDFVGGRPPLGPNMLLGSERLLTIFDGAGLDPGTTMNILGTVQTYVMGAALREMREARLQRDQEQSGIDPSELRPALTAWRNRLAADGRLPHFVAFLDMNIDPDAEETREARFEFGLDCMLDGIVAKIAQLTDHAPA